QTIAVERYVVVGKILDLAVEVGVPTEHLPRRGDAAAQADFETIGLRLALQRDVARDRVFGARVGFLDPEQRGRQREVAVQQIPLAADFVALVLFRRQRLAIGLE